MRIAFVVTESARSAQTASHVQTSKELRVQKMRIAMPTCAITQPKFFSEAENVKPAPCVPYQVVMPHSARQEANGPDNAQPRFHHQVQTVQVTRFSINRTPATLAHIPHIQTQRVHSVFKIQFRISNTTLSVAQMKSLMVTTVLHVEQINSQTIHSMHVLSTRTTLLVT